VDGTVYQNTSGKIKFATVSMSFTTGQSGFAYCDAANPPTTMVGIFGQTGATTVYEHITFIIQPNHYYKITVSSTYRLSSFHWPAFNLVGGYNMVASRSRFPGMPVFRISAGCGNF
jgi:hypothetical protein